MNSCAKQSTRCDLTTTFNIVDWKIRQKSILKIQIQRKSKRKTKTTTQRVKQPMGGRFAPPSQVPPLAFLFSFSFWFTLNLNFPHPPAPVPKREKKNHEKNDAWLKWRFRSWRSILSTNHQNRSYPQVFLATLKFAHLFSRGAWVCLIYFWHAASTHLR